MRWLGRGILSQLLIVAPALLAAQAPDVQARLEARGLPPALVQQIAAEAADATAQGLPGDVLADKAVEGWAKHATPERILAVVRQFHTQMEMAREAIRIGRDGAPPGHLVAAAAEALGRGLSDAQIADVIEAAGNADAAAPGLRVATALASQGLGVERAVRVVTAAMRRGRSVAEILDLPSIAQAMRAQGMLPAQIGERMMQGGRAGGGPGGGAGVGNRPATVPPGIGPNKPGSGTPRRP